MRLLRLQEVKQKTGLSSASIYKQIRIGAFPKGIKITRRATAWSSEDVEEWITSKTGNATVGMEVEADER